MATGDILACRIASATAHNGWVAEIDIDNLAIGGTYAFGLGTNNDPTTAKIVFSVTSQGYDATGTGTTLVRTVYATQFVRKAYPNEQTADEGVVSTTLTVRVALSDFVYDPDTSITVTMASGWYTKTGTPTNAVSGLSVTNNSTLVYPKVLGRWAWPGYETVTGNFLLEAVCFHRSVLNAKPVAAVKFTVSDGTHSVTSTVTDMTVSTRTGDANKVLVYAATIPVSILDQSAVLTCDFIAYPWVGDSGSLLDSSAGTAPPDERLGSLKLLCDKSATYGGAFAVIDAANGQNSTATTWVTATQSAAESAYVSSTANSYTTLGNAVQAIQAYNNATNGRNNAGGGTCLLTGNHVWPGTSPGSALNAQDTWLTITRLSTVARVSAAITSSTTSSLKTPRVKLYDITISGSSSGTITGTVATDVLWVDSCAINCTGSPVVYTWKLTHATRNAITAQTGGWSSFGTDKCPPALLRGNTGPTTASGVGIVGDLYCLIGNYNIRPNPIQTGNNPASHQITDNAIFAFNSNYGLNDPLTTLGFKGALSSGLAIVQNVAEKVTGTNALLSAWEDGADLDVSNILFWHNTFAGERLNIGYNDSGSTAYYRTNFSQRNNIFEEWNNKDDVFPTSNGARVGSWPVGYNVGSVGNHRRKTSSDTGNMYDTWFGEFAGVNSINNGTIGFVDDNSFNNGAGGDASGNGDYHLLTTASGYSLVPAAAVTLPFDIQGRRRVSMDGSAGAYEMKGFTPASMPFAVRIG